MSSHEAYTAIRLSDGRVFNYVWVFVDDKASPPRFGGIYPDGATGYHAIGDVEEIWGYIPGAHGEIGPKPAIDPAVPPAP